MNRKRKFYILLFTISVIAFILRYWISLEVYKSTTLSSCPPEGTDMRTYIDLSRAIFAGTFNKSFYFQPFYYAVFLPSVFLLFGKGVWNVIVCQGILGALTVFLSGLTAAMIRNRRTGIIVALLICFSLLSNFYTAFLLIATLKAFLISLLMFTTVIAIRKPHFIYWICPGLVCSCLTLTRANTILFLPLLMLISFYAMKKKIKSPPHAPLRAFLIRLIPALLILVFFIATQLPFVIHNSLIEGKLTPPSTASAVNLAIGNNPEACPAGLTYTITANYWTQHANEVSIPSRIMVWFRTSPLAVIELTFRKLLIFWDAGNVFDNIKNFADIRANVKCLNYLPLIPTSLYLIGFIAAVIILGRRILTHKMLMFPCIIVILYWLATAGFINLSRYRIAILPILALFTAILIDKLISSSNRGKTARLIKPVSVLVISSVFVFGAYPIYRQILEKRVFAWILPNGIQFNLGTEKHILDNGPFSMGSWTPMPLLPGTSLVKEFVIKPKDFGKKAEFHMNLICLENKPMQIDINGEPFTSIPTKRNMVFKFRTKVPKDGKFHIQPKVIPTGKVYGYIDLQRNYGRTGFNNQKLNGELVSRLIINESE